MYERSQELEAVAEDIRVDFEAKHAAREVGLAACRQALASLGPSVEPQVKRTLEDAVGALEQLEGRFFLKTNPAVPITGDCRADALDLARLAGSGDLAGFPQALARFAANVQKLLGDAKMEGIILT